MFTVPTNNIDGKFRTNFCIQSSNYAYLKSKGWCVTKFEDFSRTGKFDYVLINQIPKVPLVQPFSEDIP